MNSRAVKIAVSLLLTASLLCCSVSVFAVDPEPSPSIPPLDEGTGAVTDELLSRYIWMCLNAWGIQIKYQDMGEFYDNIESQIIEWVIEYLASLPSSYSINQWIAPWQADFDYWGNLRLNSNALEDIQDFANWLIGNYSLQDNQTVTVSTEMAIPCENAEGIPIYIPLNINYNNNNWSFEFDAVTDPFDIMVGFRANYVYELVSGYYVQFVFVNDVLHMQVSRTNEFVTNQLDLNIKTTRTIFDRTFEQSTGASQPFNGHNEIVVGFNPQAPQDNTTYKFFAAAYYSTSFNGGHTWVYTDSNRITTTEFNTYFMPTSVSTSITTGVILLPDDDSDYSDGDSITIIDGDPDYSDIEWDGTVTVENLPAIVSTGTIENPEIDQIYTNIPAFFQMAGDTMNGFKQILFRMPDEVLIAIYAVLAVGVIFGFLRIMREH